MIGCIKRKDGADIMATRSANVNVRVEPDVKEQAEAILEKLGVSVSSFIDCACLFSKRNTDITSNIAKA